LFFPLAISKLVGELNTRDLDGDLYCIETDVDSTIAGSPELDKLAWLTRSLCRSCGGDHHFQFLTTVSLFEVRAKVYSPGP
jgi:hypothetical protein